MSLIPIVASLEASMSLGDAWSSRIAATTILVLLWLRQVNLTVNNSQDTHQSMSRWLQNAQVASNNNRCVEVCQRISQVDGHQIQTWVSSNLLLLQETILVSYKLAVRHPYLWQGSLSIAISRTCWTRLATTQTITENYQHWISVLCQDKLRKDLLNGSTNTAIKAYKALNLRWVALS